MDLSETAEGSMRQEYIAHRGHIDKGRRRPYAVPFAIVSVLRAEEGRASACLIPGRFEEK